MIFMCRWCRGEILHLRTKGDEVCEDLICPACAEKDRGKLQETIMSLPKDPFTVSHLT